MAAACDDVGAALARVVGAAAGLAVGAATVPLGAAGAARAATIGAAAGFAAADVDAAGAGSFVNSLNVKSK